MIPKVRELERILSDLDLVIVAFSGGIDSTFLLKVAADTLGVRASAVTAVSPSLPSWELAEARSLAELIGVELVCVETHELERPGYRRNDGDRCYHCKSALFELATQLARSSAKAGATLCYGAIPDDLGDHRPGMRAALLHGVRAPLIEAGLCKAEIRVLARELGLPNWDKPQGACLSSRFPTGTPIDAASLARVERCEGALLALGFRQLRARYHGDLVRIELPPVDLERVHRDPALRDAIIAACKGAGFAHAALDLEGYRPAGLVQID